MRVAGSGGVSLNVEVAGPDDGPLLLFLHGVSGSLETYDWLPESITAGRRIARLDFRGHGLSDRAPGTYVLERYGEDVVAVLRALGAGPGRGAVLVGHSLGGNVAWWVAQNHPELLAAAFLEDPPLYRGEPEEHATNVAIPIFRATRERAAQWQAEGTSAEEVEAALAAAPMGPDGPTMGEAMAPGALAARAAALLAMDPGVLDGAADGSTLGSTDTSSPVGVPVFLLAADDARGAAFETRHAARLASTHPDVEVVSVPGASHFVHDEVATRGAYVEALERFLSIHG